MPGLPPAGAWGVGGEQFGGLDDGQDEGRDRRGGPKRRVDPAAGRKRRHDDAVTFRNRLRDEILARRRQQPEAPCNPEPPAETVSMSQWSPDSCAEQFVVVAAALRSSSPSQRLEGARCVRRLLSATKDALGLVLRTEHAVLPQLVECLARPEFTELRFEAAWCLSNIAGASGMYGRAVAEAGAVPHLVTIMSAGADTPAGQATLEQAVWCLGNIAAEGQDMRTLVLTHKCAVPLLRIIVEAQGQRTLRRNAVWAVSSLCAARGADAEDLVRLALPVVCNLLYDADEEALADACWCIAHICDHGADHTQAVLSYASGEVGRRLVHLLATSISPLQIPVLRAIGNICAGTDEQTQVMIDQQLLPMLCYLMAHLKKAVRREVCWVISNIMAGAPQHIQSCLGANLVPPLILSSVIHEFEVRKEAVWALCNATKKGTAHQLRYLVHHGVVPPIVELLKMPAGPCLLVALEGLRQLLLSSEHFRTDDDGANLVADLVRSHGGMETLENLQYSADPRVYRLAVDILEQFFGASELNASPLPPGGDTSLVDDALLGACDIDPAEVREK
eukprot:Hpha_TRINITY_DN14544_c0_g1::TRINITY_DN14544_c0_g1_i1::g.46507::m.46507